ncbi:unnamed protein product [Mytilus coruscus]|uniref:MAM domain-containing protein n=1 Tax=Mytilus coruscus TaxID=42192 RepID=A0A6J8BPA8_MYTCO|nr:unnamed protein product [Mytilus coruscus]
MQTKGFQEHTFASKSNTIRCDVNKTFSIIDFNVEPFTTSVAEYKQCNLTEEQTNAIKTGWAVNRSCTFENNYGCGWLVSRNERYKWKLRRGSTPETYTGPQKDHTTASAYGYYAYTESRSGSNLNDESDLLSGLIVPSPKQCLTFWYHMHGRHINTLKIFQRNSNHNIELWRKSKSTGTKWHFQSLVLKNIGSYQIIFKGIRGNGSKSEIAVDDISISNTVCNKVSRFDCNFEAGICEWNAELSPEYTWKIFSGKTPSLETGPGVDHTSGSSHGHYIYLEATDVQKGATSKLVSNTTNSVEVVCLTFWYHMYGESMGTLNVYTESGNITTRYWSKSGNQGNSWNFASFNISSSEPYSITFEGVCGDFYTSDIALDDIFMLQRSCSGLIKYTQPYHKTDESISLSGCSQYYLQPNSTRFVFDREFDNCSSVYQGAQTSASTLCNNENRSDVCTFNLSDVIRKDPKCFLSNRILIEYNCEGSERVHAPDILSDDAQEIHVPLDKGLVVGMVVAIALLVCVSVFIICLVRSRGSSRKTKENQKNGYNTNNSAGNRTASLTSVTADTNNLHSQLTTTQSNHCNNVYDNTELRDDTIDSDCEYSNIANTNSVLNKDGTTVAKYREYEGDVPSYNLSSHHNEHDIANQTNETSFIKGPIHQTGSTKSNMVLGHQGTIFAGSEFYTLAKPICFSDENHHMKTEHNDVYCLSEEGTYDFAGSDRHKEADGNIYSHTVDDVYDSTTHKRNDDDIEDKYDHFIGQLTEDVYDTSN